MAGASSGRKITEWLFAYGTLCDDDVQRALFGRALGSVVAALDGWALFAAPDGYLFIKPSPNGRVAGKLLELEDWMLKAADAWEDIPSYAREIVVVTTESGAREKAWAYTRREGQGTPWSGGPFGLKDKNEVIFEIMALTAPD